MEELVEGHGWRELTLSIEEVARRGLRWLPAMTIGAFIPYVIVHGFQLPALPESLWNAAFAVLMWTTIAVVVYGVSALLHEGIHVAAMVLFAGARPSSIKFGFRPREGVLYVHTDRPMSARAYRAVLLLPALVQGVFPIVFGTAWEMGWLVLYGYVMFVSAIGDLAVYQLIRPLDSHDVVRDHPTGIGCLVQTT